MMSSRTSHIWLWLPGLWFLLGLSACGSIPMEHKRLVLDNEAPVPFIDLDVFDASMAASMRSNSPKVTVEFPNQPVTINDMPERLQRWLSAVHKHGGGISVRTQEGYEQKDLMTVIGIVMSGYQLAKQSIPALVGRQYKAVIVLEGGNGVLGQVEFVRL